MPNLALYNLRVSPAPQVGQSTKLVSADLTTTTIPNLLSATEYTFELQSIFLDSQVMENSLPIKQKTSKFFFLY